MPLPAPPGGGDPTDRVRLPRLVTVCAVITAVAAVVAVLLLFSISASVGSVESSTEVTTVMPRDAVLSVSCRTDNTDRPMPEFDDEDPNAYADPAPDGYYDVHITAFSGGFTRVIVDGTYDAAGTEGIAREVLAYYRHETLGTGASTQDCRHLRWWGP